MNKIRVYESNFTSVVFITNKVLVLDNCNVVKEFNNLQDAEDYAYMNYTIFIDKDLVNESQFTWIGVDKKYVCDASKFVFTNKQ